MEEGGKTFRHPWGGGGDGWGWLIFSLLGGYFALIKNFSPYFYFQVHEENELEDNLTSIFRLACWMEDL